MATCRICGIVDNSLPEEWDLWECNYCNSDLERTVSNYYDGDADTDFLATGLD